MLHAGQATHMHTALLATLWSVHTHACTNSTVIWECSFKTVGNSQRCRPSYVHAVPTTNSLGVTEGKYYELVVPGSSFYCFLNYNKLPTTLQLLPCCQAEGWTKRPQDSFADLRYCVLSLVHSYKLIVSLNGMNHCKGVRASMLHCMLYCHAHSYKTPDEKALNLQFYRSQDHSLIGSKRTHNRSQQHHLPWPRHTSMKSFRLQELSWHWCLHKDF